MKKIWKPLVLLLTVTLCLGTLAGCTGDAPASPNAPDGGNASGPTVTVIRDIYNEPIKIALVINGLSAGNVPVIAAYENAIKDFDNITLTVFDSSFDVTRQISLMADAVAQGYDAIILDALDGDALVPAVIEAESMGVPVIAKNVPVNTSHSACVRGDDIMIGTLAAQGMYERLGNDANIVLLDCDAAQVTVVFMSKGFKDWAAANTNWNIIEHANIAQWSTENANTAMRDFLTRHDDIDGVWTAFDDMAIGAIRAIEGAGLNPADFVIWGQEGTTAMWEAIQEGKASGTVLSNQYDNTARQITMALWCIQTGITGHSAGFTATPVIYSELLNVTIDNLQEASGIKRSK